MDGLACRIALTHQAGVAAGGIHVGIACKLVAVDGFGCHFDNCMFYVSVFDNSMRNNNERANEKWALLCVASYKCVWCVYVYYVCMYVCVSVCVYILFDI